MSTLPDRQHAVKNGSAGRPPRTPTGDAFSALVIRVFRLNGLLEDEGDALARPAGQTTARWQVLAAIEDAPRSVAEIARVLSLARQSVQRVADALEGGGLVRGQSEGRRAFRATTSKILERTSRERHARVRVVGS